MPHTALSSATLGISEPAAWLDDIDTALLSESARIKSLAIAGGAAPKFASMTLSEIDSHFQIRREQSDALATLNLFGATEAALRADFLNRARRRVKQGKALNGAFRATLFKRGDRVRLREDILNLWKHHAPGVSSSVNGILLALHTRHWLAHGRYWTFKRGTAHDFAQASLAVSALLTALATSPMGFFPDPMA